VVQFVSLPNGAQQAWTESEPRGGTRTGANLSSPVAEVARLPPLSTNGSLATSRYSDTENALAQ